MFRYLKNERQLEITEKFNGVYYVTGDLIPVQILESKRLSEDDNLFLKSLNSSLKAEDMIKLLIAYQKQGKYDKNNVYIDRIMEANVRILKEVSGMSMVEVDTILKEAAFKKGWIIEAKKEGIKDTTIEVAREMLLDGEAIEKIAKWTKLPISTIKELREQLIEK